MPPDPTQDTPPGPPPPLSCVVWITGLSGAGKSTLARAVVQRLGDRARRNFVHD